MSSTRNPNIQNPEAPFYFINLLEIAEADIEQFVDDWNRRSKLMGQMPGFIRADLQKSLLPDHQYQLINVSLWQSYDAWVAAVDNPAYASELKTDLHRTSSVKVNRGFYRPVASYTHLYE
ncbi:antibiotic biosynthesis monooxygenase family protein [Paraburkholderia sp. J63]|uniref:antibiotic biosynthesis monooxygenase family protein n=1 Tax=Paraburkholderia sp. J63 TaxID=2805434 RepID=UPI002ABE14C5|nr:antibiotic biosynthesis monooxygenase family protein [Paraburkholderia sp. J63]